MRLLISGGGTGGHFFPALEVLRKCKEKNVETIYVGTARGIEEKFQHLIPGERILLETYPFKGVSLINRIKSLVGVWKGVREIGSSVEGTFKTLIFGGYPSVPAGLFTALKRRELFVHEQNSVPSTTNRLFANFSRKVFITFEYSRRFFKGKEVIKTGLPVREELLNTKIEKASAKATLGFKAESPLILFMGGSQGARFINSLAVDFARKTKAPTILLSGEKDFERVKALSEGVDNLKIYPFRTDMGLIYSASEVAVCRAGASTISELSLFGVPAIFVPYPYAVADHQYYNAKEVEELGGGFTLRQEETTPDKVIALVDRLIKDIGSYREAISTFANPTATELILNELLEGGE